jgi:hypothetical protein
MVSAELIWRGRGRLSYLRFTASRTPALPLVLAQKPLNSPHPERKTSAYCEDQQCAIGPFQAEPGEMSQAGGGDDNTTADAVRDAC